MLKVKIQDTPTFEATTVDVVNPFSGEKIGQIRTASSGDIDRIEANLDKAAKIMGRLTAHERSAILNRAADRVESRQKEYAYAISLESGKVISHARSEVKRCCNTLRLSAKEASALHGETIPFDSYPSGRKRTGYFTRDPLGSILAITPFNDPLNLVAHKLGPAIAGGNAVVLKPSERTPFSAEMLVQDLIEAGCPEEGITLLYGSPELFREVLSLPFRMVTFTGGYRAADAIIRAGGVKKYAMDLGGNAGVIVMPDADLKLAAANCVDGAFCAQGQNCIGVQRILVHRSIFEEFEHLIVDETSKLVVGDQLKDATHVGPMITENEARRAEEWVLEAVEHGATLLTGGERMGAVFLPTVLKDVSQVCRVWRDEVFAPVVSLVPFDTFEEAIALANDSDVSLHAGIFTNSLDLALEAAEQLEAGGVMINETSDYRFDGMPFGGYKQGSMGREGVRFSVEEMTQPKVVCFSR